MRNKTFRFILFLLLVSFCFACGGGSRGTGGTSVYGRISSTSTRILKNVAELENINVTILETGESDISDSDGNFKINSSQTLSNLITLEFSKNNFLAQTEVANVPVENTEVRVEVEVDQNNNTAELNEVEIKNNEQIVLITAPTSTPTPIATPTPNNSGGGSSNSGNQNNGQNQHNQHHQ